MFHSYFLLDFLRIFGVVITEVFFFKGFSIDELLSAGYSTEEILYAGYSAKELRETNFTVTQLLTHGYDHVALKRAGYTAVEFRETGNLRFAFFCTDRPLILSL